MKKEDFEYFYQLKKDNEIFESKITYYCDMLDIYQKCLANIVNSIKSYDPTMYSMVNRYITTAEKETEKLKKPLDF